jgi:hypothetical protein
MNGGTAVREEHQHSPKGRSCWSKPGCAKVVGKELLVTGQQVAPADQVPETPSLRLLEEVVAAPGAEVRPVAASRDMLSPCSSPSVFRGFEKTWLGVIA